MRRRLTLALVAFACACVAVVLFIAYLGSTLSHRAALDEMIQDKGLALLERHEAAGHEGLIELISELEDETPTVAWLYVYWSPEAGNVWAGSEALVPPDVEPTDDPAGYRIGERRLRGVVYSLPSGRGLSISRDVTRQSAFERRLLFFSLLGGVVVLALSIWAGLRASRGLVRRVDDMNAVVAALLRGSRSTRLSVRAPGDEFDELGLRFNELLDENERLLSQIREVTNDIAHDLRTPLARIRRHLEEVLVMPQSSGEWEESIREALEESSSLLDTFQALLGIARIESGAFRGDMEQVDLGRITRDAVELYEPMAEEAGLRLEVDSEPGLQILGNRLLLSQALVNLIDNAIKFSLPATTIEVSVRRAEANVELRVADRGPGIAPEDRERVLERFARLDTARATPGTGLGLSLVAATVRLHAARLTLADNEPGLVVRIDFPPPGLAAAGGDSG